ncbi:MAG: 3-isopropylmalate dehydratase small subunit [Burkholderiaceae bacterium]|nr:3-isopropylmalate dehydratase small subunit [Burkholderiaceae bacterium]
MESFVTVQGIAAAIFQSNISTDILVPSREITSASRAGYGPKLFAPWRYHADRTEVPEFVLNRSGYRDSSILIAGENFGCGSSREMAVWAVRQFGFRCVIAPSFAPIFRQNCLRNGVLPVTLPAAVVAHLAALAETHPAEWTVDLYNCSVTDAIGSRHAFEIDAREREQLLLGLDPIGVTLQQATRIDAFVEADRKLRPWIWIASANAVEDRSP